MANLENIENSLPRCTDFRLKLAIKYLLLEDAAFEDVCAGCGIYKDEEKLLLKSLLQRLDKKIHELAYGPI